MELSFDVAGQLFPNLNTMIIQWLATGVLLFFVYKYLWDPAREFIRKRAQYSQAKIEEANQLKTEADQLKQEAQAKVKQASQTARDMLENAKNEGIQIKDGIVKQANIEANQKLEEAQKEIAYQKKKMQQEVKQEMVEVALAACEKLIGEKNLEASDRQDIQDFIDKV
ncbi:MAG: F0F1 ATP synthase subunit B [Erysipelotrichaceae bacterium]|nr:F0F1 ATP synthase subunit B [Erysipelotrichaceae bacterium]MDY5252398.1 F0F1 ATP synthase subunit B [Erysipelotrichaceae bacterium]